MADGLWLTTSLWRREIDDGNDHYRYRSGSAAGQCGLNALPAPGNPVPALALHLLAWGSAARSTQTSIPVQVPGAVLKQRDGQPAA